MVAFLKVSENLFKFLLLRCTLQSLSQQGMSCMQWTSLSMNKVAISMVTVKILCIGTDRCQQTVQTKMRLLLKKQSDQGLRCLPLH